MVDAGLRLRVERMLRGDFRADDLTRLFLYVRDRCDGRESVQEIGDFVAHHDERTKGIVTRTVRDFYTICRIQIPRIGQSLDTANLPATFPEYLRAVSKRLEHRLVKRDTGLDRVAAVKMLPGIIAKMHRNTNGTLSLTPAHTEKELRLINCYGSYLVAKPAFDGARLFEDFAATLKSHGLVHKSELRTFSDLKSAIIIYAVTAMQNCIIQLGDGSTARLTAHISGPTPAIAVKSAASVIRPDKLGEIGIQTDIFLTDLNPKTHCEPELLANPNLWEGELEVTSGRLLGKLG